MAKRETIDDIDWGSVHDAFGPATKVPGTLRALASNDPDARSTALRSLFGSIFHQGTRYRSSRHAVPFLIDLATDVSRDDRVQIIGLVGSLAIGFPGDWLVGGVDASRFLSGDAEFEAGRNEFHIDELDVYRAVCDESEHLVDLCRDEDPAVRRAATFWLGFLPCCGEPGMAELATLAENDVDNEVRANAIVSIALVAQSLGTAPNLELASLMSSSEEIVRFAAAIARIRHPGDAMQSAVSQLVDAIVDPPVSTLPWNEGDLGAFAALTLAEAPNGLPGEALDILCAELAVASGPRAERLIAPLVRGLFRNGAGDVPHDPSDLDSGQRRFIDALANSATVWTVNGLTYANIANTLRRFGLPASQSNVQAYLSGAAQDS